MTEKIEIVTPVYNEEKIYTPQLKTFLLSMKILTLKSHSLSLKMVPLIIR